MLLQRLRPLVAKWWKWEKWRKVGFGAMQPANNLYPFQGVKTGAAKKDIQSPNNLVETIRSFNSVVWNKNLTNDEVVFFFICSYWQHLKYCPNPGSTWKTNMQSTVANGICAITFQESSSAVGFQVWCVNIVWPREFYHWEVFKGHMKGPKMYWGNDYSSKVKIWKQPMFPPKKLIK